MFDWLRRLIEPTIDRPNWEQRVDFWPAEYPHRIVTWANVAALKSLISAFGALNYPAIEMLVKREDFWDDLARFFNDKVQQVATEEGITLEAHHATAFIRNCKIAKIPVKIPVLLWEVEVEG